VKTVSGKVLRHSLA